MSTSLALFGLALNFLGTVIVWLFGWPQPKFDPPAKHWRLLLEEDNEDFDNEVKKVDARQHRHKQASMVGVLFVAFGFLLQGFAVAL